MSPEWNESTDPAIVDWKRVRSAIEHENTLTNQRVTWVLQSQGLLFAAYGLLTGKVIDLLYTKGPVSLVTAAVSPLSSSAESSASAVASSQMEAVVPIQLLLAVICFVGIFICALLTSGVKAANTQHARLKRWWLESSGYNVSAHPPICGEDPRIGRTFHYYHLPALFIPTWILFLAGIWWKIIYEFLNSWAMVAVLGMGAYTILVILVYKIYQRSAAKTLQ